MEEWRVKQLSNHISAALGPFGTFARTEMIDLRAFTSDPETYATYMLTKEKWSGDKWTMMKPGVYQGYRSCLTNLFKRFRFTPDPRYLSDLKMYTDGLVCLANKDVQNGAVSICLACDIWEHHLMNLFCSYEQGNINETRGIPWELYRKINRWFLKLKSNDGIFGASMQH